MLAAEATVLAAAADEAGLDAPVPTCPGWTVADLVLHVGEVHRWATAAVASQATKLGDVPSDSLGPLPEPADTIAWFRNGAAKLCETLAGADPSVEYAAFLTDPPTPRLLFWARRQTMETSDAPRRCRVGARPVHAVRARHRPRRHRRVPHRLPASVANAHCTPTTPRILQGRTRVQRSAMDRVDQHRAARSRYATRTPMLTASSPVRPATSSWPCGTVRPLEVLQVRVTAA